MSALSFDTPLLSGDELLELIPQRPPVVMVRGGESRVIIKGETYEDLVRNDV